MDTALSVTGSTVDSTLQNYAGAVELMGRMVCAEGWGPAGGGGGGRGVGLDSGCTRVLVAVVVVVEVVVPACCGAYCKLLHP